LWTSVRRHNGPDEVAQFNEFILRYAIESNKLTYTHVKRITSISNKKSFVYLMVNTSNVLSNDVPWTPIEIVII